MGANQHSAASTLLVDPEGRLDPPSRARAALIHRQKTFLAGYARLGNVSQAAEVAQIERDAHYKWLESDPTYPERFEDAKRAFGDRLHSKWTGALMAADDTAVVNHPVAYIAELKRWFPEHYREDRSFNVNVDARSLNISAGDLAGVVAELARQREQGKLPEPEAD